MRRKKKLKIMSETNESVLVQRSETSSFQRRRMVESSKESVNVDMLRIKYIQKSLASLSVDSHF